jgi:hypothetical protein
MSYVEDFSSGGGRWCAAKGYLEDEQQAGAGGSGGVELEASLGLENVNMMQLPIFLYHA